MSRNKYDKSSELGEGFGQRLTELQQSMSQREFSAKIGVPYTTFREYLKGKVPSCTFLLKVSRAFGIDAHWLLTGEGTKYRHGWRPDEMAGVREGEAEPWLPKAGELPRPAVTFPANLKGIPTGIGSKRYCAVPLVSSSTAASSPLIQPEEVQDWQFLSSSLVESLTDLVCIRVSEEEGKAMLPRWVPGSIVIIDRRNKEIRQGGIYGVKKGGGCILRRIQRQENTLILIPENPNYPIELLDLQHHPHAIVGRAICAWQPLS